jgi:hypothetical protein
MMKKRIRHTMHEVATREYHISADDVGTFSLVNDRAMSLRGNKRAPKRFYTFHMRKSGIA